MTADRRKNAAIILLGMGEHCAAEILKNMNQKEVEAIIEIMNNMDDVSEEEVIRALNEFFQETRNTTGLSATSGEYIRNTLVTAVGSEKAGSLIDEGPLPETLRGFDLLKWQPVYTIVDALEEEHPQIITIALMCLDSEKSAQVLKWLPKDLARDVIRRMTRCSPVSHYAMKMLSDYFEERFTKTEKFRVLTSDGMNMAASIMAHLDEGMETEILTWLSDENREVSEKLQDRLFPFEKLAQFDSRSLQTLLAEVSNEDMVLALKGADEDMRKVFFKCMSSKTAELLRDDMDSTGPVKLNDVLEAQKRIVELAKRLGEEEKIFMPSHSNDTIY